LACATHFFEAIRSILKAHRFDFTMNTIRLVLTVALLIPAASNAKCAWTWASNWTNDEPISPGDWIVIEGGGEAAEQLKTIAERSPRLVSGDHEVRLQLESTNIGAMNRTAVVLAPQRALHSGKTYRLVLRQGARSLERLKWTVGGQLDRRISVLGAPKVTDTRRQRFGCGPSVKIELAVETSGTTLGFLVEATGADGKSQRYLVRSRNGRISVGHGMCSGGFVFTGGQRYTVRVLSALGRTGQTVTVPARTLVATAP
jgi:hypothetical protein